MAGFCQSSAWAEIHEFINHARSTVVSIERGGARIAAALLSVRPVPAGASRASRWRRRVSGSGQDYLECIEGPVLRENSAAQTLDLLLQQVDALARTKNVAAVRFLSPPVRASWCGSDAIAEIFSTHGYRQTPWCTCLVDLMSGADEEALFKTLKHSVRKGVRKCRDAGITIELVDGRDPYLTSFLAPYRSSIGDRRPIEAKDADWLALRGAEHYRFFVARSRDGAVLATLGTYSFGGLTTEIMSGRSSEGRDSALPAQDMLHWEVMLAHRRMGASCFDLAGFNPIPVNVKEEGIKRFKEKWGGRLVHMPRFEKEFPSLMQRAARILRKH